MTREQLVETMAREIYPIMFAHSDYDEVPFAEAMSRPRYAFLKEQTIRTATAALTAIEAAGMRVVPVEPTKAMRLAALNVRLPNYDDAPLYAMVWRAMVLAAQEDSTSE